ncbi:MAG: septum formation initiator family protein [Pseudomonadota bacterium]
MGRAVKYIKILLLVSAVASAGILMGEKGLSRKRDLERNRLLLMSENEQLAAEIKSLEREVTLLGSDPKTIEKAAKRKLGMARPDETVYLFEPSHITRKNGSHAGVGLTKRHNIP